MPVKDSATESSPAAHQAPHAHPNPAMTSKKTFIEDEPDVDAPRGSSRINQRAHSVKGQNDADMNAPVSNVNRAESKPATSTAFDPIAAWGQAASSAVATFRANKMGKAASKTEKKGDDSSGKGNDDDAASDAGSENSITSEDLVSMRTQRPRTSYPT